MSSDSTEHLRQMIARVQQMAAAGRWNQAAGLLDEMIALKPGDANLWYNKGVALTKLEALDDALVALLKAIELNPGHSKAAAAIAELRAIRQNPHSYASGQSSRSINRASEVTANNTERDFVARRASSDTAAPPAEPSFGEFIKVGSTGQSAFEHTYPAQSPKRVSPSQVRLPHGSTILTRHSIYIEGTPPELRRTWLPQSVDEEPCDPDSGSGQALAYVHRRLSGVYCRLVAADCPGVDIDKYTNWFLSTADRTEIVLDSRVDLGGDSAVHVLTYAPDRDGWSEFDILAVVGERPRCIRIYGSIRGNQPDDLAPFVNLASRIHSLPASYTVDPDPSPQPAALASRERVVFGRSERCSIVLPSDDWQVEDSLAHRSDSLDFDIRASIADELASGPAGVYVRALPLSQRDDDAAAADVNDTATGWIMELAGSATFLEVYELRDTSVDGNYAVTAELVYRRQDSLTRCVLAGFTTSRDTLWIMDCDLPARYSRQTANIIFRSLRLGGPSEHSERANPSQRKAFSGIPSDETGFDPDPDSGSGYSGPSHQGDDDLDESALSELPRAHSVALNSAYGLFALSGILSVLHVAGMRGQGWNLAWWICALLAAAAGVACGVIWQVCYRRSHFQNIGHFTSYDTFRLRSWLPAAAGASVVCLGLAVWLIWPVAALGVSLGAAYLIYHRSPGAILDTDRVLVAAATLPEYYVSEAKSVSQLLVFDDLCDAGVLGHTGGDESVLGAAHSANARCVVCEGLEPDKSVGAYPKMHYCALCGERVCRACESDVTETVVCTNCHRVGAVCDDCGTYYRDRLSLLSCAGCGEHFCEKCSAVRELPKARTIVPDEMFHPVVIDMIRPYVHDTGKQRDWVIVCRSCEAHGEDGSRSASEGTGQRTDAAVSVPHRFRHEMRLASAAAGAADAPRTDDEDSSQAASIVVEPQ